MSIVILTIYIFKIIKEFLKPCFSNNVTGGDVRSQYPASFRDRARLKLLIRGALINQLNEAVFSVDHTVPPRFQTHYKYQYRQYSFQNIQVSSLSSPSLLLYLVLL